MIAGSKVFVDESNEFFPDSCFYVLAEEWVKPNYVFYLFCRDCLDLSAYFRSDLRPFL